ncbi:MAG: sigma-54-dependent Fis family transcriptional regulator [Burkholderiaceae bacterium]|nr:sigma-54-dependent Fis family transcriptional regulator [Burkholderiaceae bacterium]
MSPSVPTPRLLVVDDEPDLRTLYELTLVREGYDVDCAGSVTEAWALLALQPYDLLITDMRLPDGNGMDLLARLESAARAERTIVITAFASPENAVEALKAGAYDYLTKPVDLRQFRAVVASALGRGTGDAGPSAGLPRPARTAGGARLDTRPAGIVRGGPAPAAGDAAVRGEPDAAHAALARLAGASTAMAQVRELVAKVARSMAPVLVHGESGTGKELVARAIHACSPRAAGPFVAVNCGAIPEPLLEAEFFGYRKGAFTGAAEDREGFFQAAAGGTLFLDEIGELPLAMQSKLLRVIQERAVRPVGAVQEQPTDVRLVSATHKDLGAEARDGRFRQDLYYRLNVIGIGVPPLRERVDDLPAICDAVLARIAREAGVWPPPTLAPEALARLARQRFAGNVRELENLLHRALALTGGDRIDARDLGLGDGADDALSPDAPAAFPGAAGSPRAPALTAPDGSLPSDLQAHLDAVERDILERALRRHRYNRTAAGASLGLSLRQMRYRMARLGIDGGPGDAVAREGGSAA